jgi:hypothetical protein
MWQAGKKVSKRDIRPRNRFEAKAVETGTNGQAEIDLCPSSIFQS